MTGRGVKMRRHLPTWRVAGRGVKTWRHLPTRRQGQVDVASKRGVTGPASGDVTSKWGVTGPRREPGGVAGRGVKMRRHLPTWHQGSTCGRRRSASAHASGLTWRRRTWRQNGASLAKGGAGGRTSRQNVASDASTWSHRTWRHEARLPGTYLQNVSSIVGRYVHPHRRPPCSSIFFIF